MGRHWAKDGTLAYQPTLQYRCMQKVFNKIVTAFHQIRFYFFSSKLFLPEQILT